MINVVNDDIEYETNVNKTKEISFEKSYDNDVNANSALGEDTINRKTRKEEFKERMRRIRIDVSNIIKHSTCLF